MAAPRLTLSSRPWLLLALVVGVCAAAFFAFFFPGGLPRSEPAPAAQQPRTLAVTPLPPSGAPSALSVPTPCAEAKRGKGYGTLIEAVVNEAGRVESACVVISSTPAFDRKALEAVRSQQYTPVLYKGAPAKAYLTVSVVPHLGYGTAGA